MIQCSVVLIKNIPRTRDGHGFGFGFKMPDLRVFGFGLGFKLF